MVINIDVIVAKIPFAARNVSNEAFVVRQLNFMRAGRFAVFSGRAGLRHANFFLPALNGRNRAVGEGDRHAEIRISSPAACVSLMVVAFSGVNTEGRVDAIIAFQTIRVAYKTNKKH